MQHLNERFVLDLWLVTHVVGDQQTVVAAAGHWETLATPGTEFSWRESFCLAMVKPELGHLNSFWSTGSR